MTHLQNKNGNRVFLTAEWRKLNMVNYLIEPDRLKTLVPPKTELDFWNGQCYISLVAFMFMNTAVRGCRFPFHTNFEEVNLRFYVRYKDEGQWKRGVVFIREFVPLPMVTLIANTLYRERYLTVPMRHRWSVAPDIIEVQYSWKRPQWNSLEITAENKPELIAAGSEEEFITQHFWGYSIKPGGTSEYQVAHELWQSYRVTSFDLQVDYLSCYGSAFGFLDKLQPHSVYLVEGSVVNVYKDRLV